MVFSFSHWPYLGRSIRSFPLIAVSQLLGPLLSCRILYEIKLGNDIVVLAVIHRRRDLENLPNKPWDDG